MTKRTYYTTLVFFIIITIFIVWIVGLFIYPYKLVKFNDDKFPVLTPIVRAGEELQFQVDFYRYTKLPTKVSRQLINDYVYYYTEITASNPQGHIDKIGTVTIPSNIEPGVYFLRNIYKYEVNFLRTITIVKDTEKFEVIK